MWPMVCVCVFFSVLLFFPLSQFRKCCCCNSKVKWSFVNACAQRITKKNPSVCFRSWVEITFTVKFNVFVTHTNFASAAAVAAANFQLSREWMPQQYNIQLTNLYSFTSPLFSIIDCLCSAITERVLTKKKKCYTKCNRKMTKHTWNIYRCRRAFWFFFVTYSLAILFI